MLDFRRYKVITFDCYGTLIDWESGIFSALRPILAAHKKSISDSEILGLYAELEVAAEAGEYHTYREVLRTVVRGFGEHLGFQPSEAEMNSLPDSVATWKPFADTVESLRRLKQHFQLAIISNIDDAMFAASARRLEVPFDYITTAQQAKCYKPGLNIFNLAMERIGVGREFILHAGQSIYHDVIPARSLGLATIWVNRRSPRPNAGAAKAAQGQPDLEVPDLRTLADQATL